MPFLYSSSLKGWDAAAAATPGGRKRCRREFWSATAPWRYPVAPFQGFKKKTTRKNDSASVDLGRCPRLLRPSLSGWTPPRSFPAQSAFGVQSPRRPFSAFSAVKGTPRPRPCIPRQCRGFVSGSPCMRRPPAATTAWAATWGRPYADALNGSRVGAALRGCPPFCCRA